MCEIVAWSTIKCLRAPCRCRLQVLEILLFILKYSQSSPTREKLGFIVGYLLKDPGPFQDKKKPRPGGSRLREGERIRD